MTTRNGKAPIAARASTRKPCEVCGSGTKGCSVTDDGLHLCRGEPTKGWMRITAEEDPAGFHHYRRDEHGGRLPSWQDRARQHANQLKASTRKQLAGALGLPAAALNHLPMIGFSASDPGGACWTFPECDAAGQVIGLNRRYVADGSKKAMAGSTRGLTIPAGWKLSTGPVLLVEGASDVLALSQCGIAAIGRPSNTGGAEQLAKLLDDIDADRPIYLLGENDQKDSGQWPGREGVERVGPRLATTLGQIVRTAFPPHDHKDCREWVLDLAKGQGEAEDWEAIGVEVLKWVEESAEDVVPERTLTTVAATPSANGKHAKALPEPGPGFTAAELVRKDFPPPRYTVDGLLTEGLTILGGRPKQGKSWLSLLIAWAVAAGYDLDGRTVLPGAVLYLALEDTPRRLKQRLLMLNAGTKWRVPPGLTLHTSWPRADEGGLTHIAAWANAQPRGMARTVIVDTLAKFRPQPKAGSNSYADDYAAIGDLQKLCGTLDLSGIGVHHTRKLRAEDPFDELSGTLGVSGAADSLWVLDRTRGQEAGELYLTGRDLPEATISLAFSKADCRWKIGANKEGIDTASRAMISPAATKLEQCKAWLLDFLRVYAHPSKEIESAASAAGFSPAILRDAKVALGSKGTGEVTHRNFGRQGENDWWSGIGPPIAWKRRFPTSPGPRLARSLGESGESENEDSEAIPD